MECLVIKGFVMTSFFIVAFLVLCYLVLDRVPSRSPPKTQTEFIAEQVKEEINNYFGGMVVSNVDMVSVGRGFEGDTDESGVQHLPTYMISASVQYRKKVTCVHILSDDLTPIGVHLATNNLILKIKSFKGNLRVTC